jgi:hypothetical protein
MCVSACRIARAAVCAVLSASLLSGCATLGGNLAPAALGAGKHRSIKDDPEPAAGAPPPPQRKAAATAPPRIYRPAAGRPIEQPSCGTGTDCLVRLKSLIADPDRRWIGQPASSAEYANGTRLFAYRALRDRLSCSEIALALTEIEAADSAFRSPVPGVSANQASRVLALGAEVAQALRAEFKGRCLS